MNSLEIRKKFFDFFVHHGHTMVPSSSLIPAQDPTLLFANAGMNQFKDLFLGKETRSYARAVSIQKCIRAGGKHNDLEQVGFTKRHLTFFEMMGNFSFGNYFKKDAIRFAWDFLTQEIGLEKDKLYASVYKHDDEAYTLWHQEIGLPTERIVRLGEADNFWQMGDTGPCGPCSEIYIDRGSHLGCGKQECLPGCSCDRFLEIWNLVFMQYDKQLDGTNDPLKQTGVDTGMGLERLCAVVQGKDSVFDTDIFVPLIKRIEELTGISYEQADPKIRGAFRVIIDHVRSSSFAIADGCIPSNEGRGYVVRKIIRRAALFAQKLGSKNIFPELLPTLVEHMAGVYPELTVHESRIQALLTGEVEKFAQQLIVGQQMFEKYIQQGGSSKIISGEQAFKLYDTYGFPLELTNLIAQERGYTVDSSGFDREMERQREQSGKKSAEQKITINADDLSTTFTGYDQLETSSKISALFVDSLPVAQVTAGTVCVLVPEKTPLYAESGGQIADRGSVEIRGVEIPVQGIIKLNNAIAVVITTPIAFNRGDMVIQRAHGDSRGDTERNHTATHLLQAALINIIGSHIKQAGSAVHTDYLRFDFVAHEQISPEQLRKIEEIVNQTIIKNIPVTTTQTTYNNAVSRGVIAFFGEKYNPDNVRLVEVAGVSAELCGGTHVKSTGQIGAFKIVESTALAAGVRRIVAVTGKKALALFQDIHTGMKGLSQEFKVPEVQVVDAVLKQKEQLRLAHVTIRELRKKMMMYQIAELRTHITKVKSLDYGYFVLAGSTAELLRDAAQELQKRQPGFYVLLVPHDDGVGYSCLVSSCGVSHEVFTDMVSWLKKQGIQGGGSAGVFQGKTAQLDAEFDKKIREWLSSHL